MRYSIVWLCIESVGCYVSVQSNSNPNSNPTLTLTLITLTLPRRGEPMGQGGGDAARGPDGRRVIAHERANMSSSKRPSKMTTSE